MGENTGRLSYIWARNTVLLGLALLIVGIWQGFDSRAWTLCVVLAVVLEVMSTIAVIKAWLFAARYHWFWWL